nr:uncharacterized protein LOC111986867 [Quercus suber]
MGYVGQKILHYSWIHEISLFNRSPPPSLDTVVNELVGEEARLATLQTQNKLNVLAISPSAPPTEQPPQSGFDSSGSGNCRKQTNKKFCNYCKRHGHTIETCYHRNKSTTAVANIEFTLPMPSISADSQSSGSTINLSFTKLQDIIAQVVRMVGNSSLSTTLSVLPDKIRGRGKSGPRVERMFPLDNLHLPPVAPVSVAPVVTAVSSLPCLALWHSRLGHASSSRVQQLASKGLLGSVSKDNFYCTSCQLGKQLALPFNNSESIC